MSEPQKPWSVAVFEQHRPHLTNFVRNKILPLIEDIDCRRIIVRAPVKCGKREMVEYISMRDSVNQPKRVHAFLSAWHRQADEEQRLELSTHNIKVFSIINQKKVEEFLTWLNTQQAHKHTILLHIDECDHGSGSKQMLSKIWPSVRNTPNITNILYSATPQEVLFSGEVEDDEFQSIINYMIREGEHVEYSPPMGYCGPKIFLEAGLVNEATPFFYKEDNKYVLSPQGKQIVSDIKDSLIINPSRNLIVLRLSYSDTSGKKSEIKKNKAIYQFLENISAFPELSDFLVVVDKSDSIGIKNPQVNTEKIQWSALNYWRRQAIGIPMLLVIDQTSSRSTEWRCHDRIFATHDYRNVVQYGTTSQAQERPNHYAQRYGGFQPIRIYGYVKTFMLSAGLIDYKTFLNDDWEKKKIDTRTSGPVPMYRVRSVLNGALHPDCPETGLPEITADRILQELGCYADKSLSARVAGSIREVPTYAGVWQEVTKDTWPTFWPAYSNSMPPAESTRAVRNPFIVAEKHRLPDGTWQGQHRGWKVLDCVNNELFQRIDGEISKKLDLGSTGGDRIKVCYKDGTLGVFIVRYTGTISMETLCAYNSMYKNI
jgi:hypothetical protein